VLLLKLNTVTIYSHVSKAHN